MAKVLKFIGLAAIALGILFMGLGFFAGGAWTFLLAAQVGFPAILSGIVFMAFGYVVELLESINTAVRSTNEANAEASRAKVGSALRLDDISSPVRVLRSIGDAVGGPNDKQRAAIVDFVGYCAGSELSKEQRSEVGAWIDVTSGPLQQDLEQLRFMSPNLLRRFQSSICTVANASGVMHSNDERKHRTEAAVNRIKSYTTQSN